MKSSARTFKIMEYVVSAWWLLLSFYWIGIGNLMNESLPFFGVAVASFLLGCTYLLQLLREQARSKKILLLFFVVLTILASVATLFFAPACTCKLIGIIDLLPQFIGCFMVIILFFTRPV